jgi:predicted DsbA family dithiol-disulfide isomerase
MTDTIRFHFDPRCPWAWESSRWIREVARVRDIEIEWAFFSLQEQNKPETAPLRDPEVRGTAALRTLALVRRTEGNDAVDSLYRAIGERVHEQREDFTIDVVRNALEDVGLKAIVVDEALSDDVTIKEVSEEHYAVASSVGCFGVPTIVLPTGEAIFGPVVSVAPTGEAAGELWDHVEWLTRQGYFFEMKRERGDTKPGSRGSRR